ncbi:hypothetical protein ID866_3475 [Astraeus odoratus]|nr:hypothetical protein ID866_3475 [Astraeus odoratus]
MALTAAAQSALPTWDDTIVPALRKRLESESRILAKRMSVASITSADDSPRSNTPSKSSHISREQRAPAYSPEPRKGSAIPRPSLQHQRGAQDSYEEPPAANSRSNGASTPLIPRRTRTRSQPPIFDPLQPNGHPNGTSLPPPDSRPTSPRTGDVRPTRIPIATRNRTVSTSSYAHSIAPKTEPHSNVPPVPSQSSNPEPSPDLWVVQEADRTPMPSIRHHHSNLMNEPPPFPTSSATSSTRSRGYESTVQVPRPSTDSEERPFEHWYRGDVYRNGGVGELRVAKHMEMLQIANFGHKVRRPVRSQTRDVSGPSDYGRTRKRAESAGAGTRESLCLDDERAQDVDNVLNESPLTDIEGDADTDTETFYDAYIGTDDTTNLNFSASTPQLPLSNLAGVRSETPVTVHPSLREDTTPPCVPMSRTISETLSSDAPSGPAGTTVESAMPAHPSSGSCSRVASGTTSPVSQSSDQSQAKRSGKNHVTPSPASTPKKSKAKGKTPPPVSRQKEDPRHSVAMYPTPEGDAVDAIPTWTQPVQKSGNWDDVVLPVVARKKGLDGQYEQADGSPRPKPPEETLIKPAPGTFGFDYSKYKRPRTDEEIPMDEFGQVQEQLRLVVEEKPPRDGPLNPPPRVSVQEAKESARKERLSDVPRVEVPPPFSQYMHVQVPTINVTRPSIDAEQKPPADEGETGGAGCCKCVIM